MARTIPELLSTQTVYGDLVAVLVDSDEAKMLLEAGAVLTDWDERPTPGGTVPYRVEIYCYSNTSFIWLDGYFQYLRERPSEAIESFPSVCVEPPRRRKIG